MRTALTLENSCNMPVGFHRECNVDRHKELQTYLNNKWKAFQHDGIRKRHDLMAAKVLKRIARRRKFKDQTTERLFNDRNDRVRKAIAIETPDRVPLISSGVSFYPAFYAGVSPADYCNDRRTFREAYIKFVAENTWFDAMFPSQLCHQGPMIRATQLDILKLPGVNLPDNVPYQFVERERLKPEEYQGLIKGGWDFFLKTVVPRMTPLYDPEKGWGKGRLIKLAWLNLSYGLFYIDLIDVVEKRYGVPVDTGAMFFAPYDLVSFLFRTLEGISTDLFRHPETVEDAVHMMEEPTIRFYENVTTATGTRGAVLLCERAFSLSPRQFKRFYLPGLKIVVQGLLDRGILPILALQQDCTHLIEFLLELPPQSILLNLDTSDIFKAAKVLRGHMCIAGNVPMNMMVYGKPGDIQEYCKKLINELAGHRGFIMSGALGIPDNAKAENVRAMAEYTLQNGKY